MKRSSGSDENGVTDRSILTGSNAHPGEGKVRCCGMEDSSRGSRCDGGSKGIVGGGMTVVVGRDDGGLDSLESGVKNCRLGGRV